MKNDLPSVEHLDWSVTSRSANQKAMLKLYTLFERHPVLIKKHSRLKTAAFNLVGVGFSLWRAAFLADLSDGEAVFGDAKAFLGKILTDNTIAFPTDRSSRDWTFFYYMINAKDRLAALPQAWQPLLASRLKQKKKLPEGTTFPQHRWDRHQAAFEIAIDQLAKDLEHASKHPSDLSSEDL